MLKKAAVVLLIVFAFIALQCVKGFRSHYTANKILKSIENYSLIKNSETSIYFTEGDREFAKIILSVISTYKPLLMKEFQSKDCGDIEVIVYPSKRTMFSAIGYSDKSAVLPMGAYAAQRLIILSPAVWQKTESIDAFLSEGPIIHELTHLIFDRRVKGNYREWFSEGVALYYENKYTDFSWNKNGKAGKNISFKELSSNFRQLDERESYRKSYEIIRYLAETEGEAALKTIYEDLSKGRSLNSALKKQTGNKLSIFDSL